MKGMMAAELAVLAACVPCPPEQFCFYFLYNMDKILYVEISSTSLKKGWGWHWLNDVKGAF